MVYGLWFIIYGSCHGDGLWHSGQDASPKRPLAQTWTVLESRSGFQYLPLERSATDRVVHWHPSVTWFRQVQTQASCFHDKSLGFSSTMVYSRDCVMEDFANLKPHLHSCLFGPVTLNWTSNPQRTTPRPLPSNLRFILPHTELHGYAESIEGPDSRL